MSTLRVFITNLLRLGLLQGVNVLLTMITIPLLLYYFGIKGLGIISVVHALMFYLAIVTEYGFNISATGRIARAEKLENTGSVFYAVLSSKLLISVILFALCSCILYFIPSLHIHLPNFFAAYLYVLGQAFFAGWFLQGKGKLHIASAISLGGKAITLALVIFSLGRSSAISTYLLYFGIGNCMAGIASVVYTARKYGLSFQTPARADVALHMREGWPVLVSGLSTSTAVYSTIFILRVFTNDVLVGYYAIAERLILFFRQGLSLFSQSVYPLLCSFVVDREKARRFFTRLWIPLVCSMLILGGILFLFAPGVINIFSGKVVDMAPGFLKIMAFIPFLSCLQISPVQTMLVAGKFKNYAMLQVIALITHVLLCCLGAAFFQPFGIAYGQLLNECLLLLMLLWGSRNVPGYVRIGNIFSFTAKQAAA
jgi:PST family polysaccharide transporter